MGVGSSKPLNASNKVVHDLQQWKKLEFVEETDYQAVKAQTISCYRSKRQRTLHLYDLRLVSLPNCVWQLTHLKILKLPNNQLTHISPLINSMRCLKHLDVSHNKLTCLPEMPGLSQLKILLAQDNQLRVAPASLCQLPNLLRIDMSGNKGLTLPYVLAKNPRFHEIKNNSLASLQHIYRDLKRILIDGNILDEETGHLPLIIEPIGELKAGKDAFTHLLKKLEVRDTLSLSQISHIIDFTRRTNTLLKKMIKNAEIREDMYLASLQLCQSTLKEEATQLFPSEALDILQLLEQAYYTLSFKADTLALLCDKSMQLFALHRAEQFIEEHYTRAEEKAFKSKNHFRINLFYALKGYFEYYSREYYRRGMPSTKSAYISAFDWAGILGFSQYIPSEQCKALVDEILFATKAQKQGFARTLYDYPFWQTYLQEGYKKDPTVTKPLYKVFAQIEKLKQESADSFTEDSESESETVQDEAIRTLFATAIAQHL
jgi:hypothetical protein